MAQNEERSRSTAAHGIILKIEENKINFQLFISIVHKWSINNTTRCQEIQERPNGNLKYVGELILASTASEAPITMNKRRYR